MSFTPGKVLSPVGFTRRNFLAALAALLPSATLFGRSEAKSRMGSDADYHHHTAVPGKTIFRELENWKSLPRRPIRESTGGLDPLYIEAIWRREPLYVTYHSREYVRQIRRLMPLLLFTVDRPDGTSALARRIGSGSGRFYLQAWDYDRSDERTFDTGRITVPVTAPWMWPRTDGSTPPQEVMAKTYAWLRRHNVRPVPKHTHAPANYDWKEL